jgi:hypothetical protein
MKSISLLFFIFALGCSHNLKKPLFYKIEKDGKTSHVLASIDRGVPYSRVPKYIKEIIKSSEAVYIPELTPNDPEQLKPIIEQLVYKLKDEPSLFEILDAKTYQYAYETIVSKYPEDKFLSLITSYGARSLVNQIDPKRVYVDDSLAASQFNSSWGIKEKIVEEKGAAVYSLEDRPFWLNPAFRKCFSMVNALALQDAAQKQTPRDLKWMLEEAEIYKTGEEVEVNNYVLRKAAMNGKLYAEDCVKSRNQFFVKRVEATMAMQPSGFYVLDIENVLGVLDGLKSNGFKIERVIQP